jgi:hypothetical protein
MNFSTRSFKGANGPPSFILAISSGTAQYTPSELRKTMVSFSLPWAALATTKPRVALSPSVLQWAIVTQNVLDMILIYLFSTLEIHFLFFRMNFVKVLIPHKAWALK